MTENELIVDEIAAKLGLFHLIGSEDELYPLILRRIDFYMDGHTEMKVDLEKLRSVIESMK